VAGEFELAIDNTAGCGSAIENVDLPALVANTWKLATIAITTNTTMTAIQCVGLNVATDNGAQIFNIDEVIGQGQVTSLILTLTNALQGEPVDVTEPSDSDDNGVSDSDSIHSLILTYSDKNQVVRDVYWTQTFVGNNDSDNLIESGEKVELTVSLKGLSGSYPVIGDTRFDVEIRPEDGGVVVVQRSMPDIIDLVMNLN
jgi:archaellin